MTKHQNRAVAALGSAALTGAALVAAPQAAHADSGDAGRMVLLLDSSGSMKEPAQGGMTKIDAAKKALTSVVSTMPTDVSLGLRVFGASVENKTDPGACTDSQLVVPPGTQNHAALQAAVSTYKPYGETPIGYALQEAAKDLGTTGKRSIVLVSDGIATCKPDPCDVARQIAAQGVDVSIDVVGMSVDTAARKQLQCIASAGHGKYYDANTADQLAGAIEQAKTHVASTAQLLGKPVAGSDSAVGAPTITSGDWRDSIGGAGKATSVKYYTLHRTIPGSSIEAAVIFPPSKPKNPNEMAYFGDALGTELTVDGRNCGLGNADGERPLQSATSLAPSDDDDATCTGATDLVLKVRHDEMYSSSADLPMQIRVTEVPPVMNAASLPAPPKDYTSPPEARVNLGGAVPLHGGSSLASGVMIDSGKSYSDTLLPGEVQVYKVPVGYGQQISVKGMVPDASPALKKEIEQGNQVLGFTVTVLDPAGMRVNRAAQVYLGLGGTATTGTDQPITFKRGFLDSGLKPWLAGYYTIVVGLQDGRISKPVPFAVSALVSGTITGEPVFAKPGQAVPAPSASASTDASASAEVSDSPSPQASDTPTTDPTAEASTSPAAASRGKGRTLPLLLGVVGLALVAGGIAIGARRRR